MRSLFTMRVSATLTLALAAYGASAHAQTDRGSVELYTMGPGDDVFSRYGHAALCVRDDETPDGRCYNYGTTDFSTPVPLTWDVLRGRARFWVSVSSLEAMLAWYGPAGQDRTVWRQRVALSDVAFAALQQRLRDDMRPGSREYTYHHFRDNCTTRLRDHLDAVTDGALRRGADDPHPESWRDIVQNGLAASPAILVAGELLLGRPLDVRPTRWEAMFLPSVMRDEVTRAYGAAPETLYERTRPTPGGDRRAGRAVLAAVAVALGALGALARTRGAIVARVARSVTGVALGGAGAVVWLLALATTLPELSQNDLRVVLSPTDLALGALTGSRLRWYAIARVAMALTASAASALGVTAQPLLAPAMVVVLGMLPWALRSAANARGDLEV